MFKLCGGTFFVLLSNARKPMPSNSTLKMGKKSGLTEVELLLALARLVVPELQDIRDSEKRTAQNGVGQFKACKNWGGTLYRLNDSSAITSFKTRFHENRAELLLSMQNLIDIFIETNTSTKKDEYLVKSIVEVILQDEGIKSDQEFYIGETITKAGLRNTEVFNLPSFLLGIWYFVITEIEDNAVGQETFEQWCPPQSGAKRVYKANIGENSSLQIKLTYGLNFQNDDIPLAVEVSEPTPKTSHEIITERMLANGRVMANVFGAAIDAIAADIQKKTTPIIPEIPVSELDEILTEFSREYYQLIITNAKIFNVKFVDVSLDRALSSSTPAEIRDRCGSLSKEGKAELYSFPAIICNENTGYNGCTDEHQLAIFAKITRIKKGEKEVRIYFRPIASFPQTKLNDYSVDFGLSVSSTLATLNTSQWTVRAVDLFETFEDTEIDVPIPNSRCSDTDSKRFWGKESISEEDYKYLQAFYSDYDDLLWKCVKTDFAEEWIDASIPENIEFLYQNKWERYSTKIRNQLLRTYIFSVLGTLNDLLGLLTPQFVFLLPDGNHLRMIHDTFEDDDRNDTVFRPAIWKIRLRLRNLYVKLHPEDYAGITSYEEAFEDWSEGEDY